MENAKEICVNAFKNYKDAYFDRDENDDTATIIRVNSNNIESEIKVKY